MKVSLHPAAYEDLRSAAMYYRDSAGAAICSSFLAEYERSAGILLLHPQLGSAWCHGKRRLPLRHFPFSIIYAVAGDDIRILAIAHHNRRPGYGRRRA